MESLTKRGLLVNLSAETYEIDKELRRAKED